MPGYVGIVDTSTSNIAGVNASKELQVALSQEAEDAGFAKMLDGDGRKVTTTEHGYQNVSIDDLVFVDQVDGAALNTNRWATSVSGMTIAQASGYITLNNGGTTAATNYAILSTVRYMPMFGYLPTKISINAFVSTAPEPNATMELGIGLVSGSSAPTDGAFFRWTPAGDFRAVVNNAGAEIVSAALTAPVVNDATLFDIVVVEDTVLFCIDDEVVVEVDVAIGQSYPTSGGRLPVFARTVTAGGSASIAPKINIGQVIVVQQGVSQDKPWDDIQASIGNGAYQSPVTTFAQTSNHANSTSPSSASLSNTAAGYTTLGGRYQFAAVGSAATDFALFAYQVPTGFQLYVKSIAISAVNTGAVVAITPTVLDWAVGINASAVSLATADGAGTWAPRRIPIGMQSLLAADLIGKTCADVSRRFDVPLVVDSGRFLHIILQVPIGTATASQVIRGDVMINGYFE